MIVWGGIGSGPTDLNTGGRYCAGSGATPTPTPTATITPTATTTPTSTPTGSHCNRHSNSYSHRHTDAMHGKMCTDAEAGSKSRAASHATRGDSCHVHSHSERHAWASYCGSS